MSINEKLLSTVKNPQSFKSIKTGKFYDSLTNYLKVLMMIDQTHNLIFSFADFILFNVIILLDDLHELRLVDFLVISLLFIDEYTACMVIFHT